MASSFTDELRGWKETATMSDDARRKVWLMHTAAIEIERLRELVANERIECAKIAEDYNGDGIEIADLIRKRPVVTY